jgi:hypothetical protein
MALLAGLVLAIHLSWILWVVFGAFFTRRRKFLTAFHLASLIWGIVVELSALPCPLTMAEEFFEQKAGEATYHRAFLVHYLDRLVYPDLPVIMLVGAGVAICILNLGVYGWRYWRGRTICP